MYTYLIYTICKPLHLCRYKPFVFGFYLSNKIMFIQVIITAVKNVPVSLTKAFLEEFISVGKVGRINLSS